MKEVSTNNFSDADDADYTNRKLKESASSVYLRLKNIKSYSSLNSASLSDCKACFLSHSRIRKEML